MDHQTSMRSFLQLRDWRLLVDAVGICFIPQHNDARIHKKDDGFQWSNFHLLLHISIRLWHQHKSQLEESQCVHIRAVTCPFIHPLSHKKHRKAWRKSAADNIKQYRTSESGDVLKIRPAVGRSAACNHSHADIQEVIAGLSVVLPWQHTDRWPVVRVSV